MGENSKNLTFTKKYKGIHFKMTSQKEEKNMFLEQPGGAAALHLGGFLCSQPVLGEHLFQINYKSILS